MVGQSLEERVRRELREIPDYPKPGILFQDITPVLRHAGLLAEVTAALAAPFAGQGVTLVAGIEARGFLLAGPVAHAVGAGLIPLRKPGKLPWQTERETYALEYGEDALEAHQDACGPGDRVLIVDDVLATGGTAAAAARLVQRLGAEVVGWSFLLEIAGLGGRGRIFGAPCHVVTSPK